MNTLIGHTGFVGQNLMDQIYFEHCYNSKNINEINNIEHDIVYCCGISGNKYLANKNPEEDRENIDNLISALYKLKCNKFILISTIDILIDCPYGKNRLIAENKISEIFDDKLYIFRLGGLFGNYLKKNLLFDLINEKYFSKINLENKLQWYYIGDLREDIQTLIDFGIHRANLFNEPISTREIVENFFEFDSNNMYSDKKSAVIYDFKSSFDGYWHDKSYILKKLGKWLKKEY